MGISPLAPKLTFNLTAFQHFPQFKHRFKASFCAKIILSCPTHFQINFPPIFFKNHLVIPLDNRTFALAFEGRVYLPPFKSA